MWNCLIIKRFQVKGWTNSLSGQRTIQNRKKNELVTREIQMSEKQTHLCPACEHKRCFTLRQRKWRITQFSRLPLRSRILVWLTLQACTVYSAEHPEANDNWRHFFMTASIKIHKRKPARLLECHSIYNPFRWLRRLQGQHITLQSDNPHPFLASVLLCCRILRSWYKDYGRCWCRRVLNCSERFCEKWGGVGMRRNKHRSQYVIDSNQC